MSEYLIDCDLVFDQLLPQPYLVKFCLYWQRKKMLVSCLILL